MIESNIEKIIYYAVDNRGTGQGKTYHASKYLVEKIIEDVSVGVLVPNRSNMNDWNKAISQWLNEDNYLSVYYNLKRIYPEAVVNRKKLDINTDLLEPTKFEDTINNQLLKNKKHNLSLGTSDKDKKEMEVAFLSEDREVIIKQLEHQKLETIFNLEQVIIDMIMQQCIFHSFSDSLMISDSLCTPFYGYLPSKQMGLFECLIIDEADKTLGSYVLKSYPANVYRVTLSIPFLQSLSNAQLNTLVQYGFHTKTEEEKFDYETYISENREKNNSIKAVDMYNEAIILDKSKLDSFLKLSFIESLNLEITKVTDKEIIDEFSDKCLKRSFLSRKNTFKNEIMQFQLSREPDYEYKNNLYYRIREDYITQLLSHVEHLGTIIFLGATDNFLTRDIQATLTEKIPLPFNTDKYKPDIRYNVQHCDSYKSIVDAVLKRNYEEYILVIVAGVKYLGEAIKCFKNDCPNHKHIKVTYLMSPELTGSNNFNHYTQLILFFEFNDVKRAANNNVVSYFSKIGSIFTTKGELLVLESTYNDYEGRFKELKNNRIKQAIGRLNRLPNGWSKTHKEIIYKDSSLFELIKTTMEGLE